METDGPVPRDATACAMFHTKPLMSFFFILALYASILVEAGAF